MEKQWLKIPTDRKSSRGYRLCVLLGVACLALILSLPGREASGGTDTAALTTAER